MLEFASVTRLVALLLLLFMPMQFALASVAALCATERQPVSHFAHHEHASKGVGAPVANGPSEEAPSSNADGHCVFCEHAVGHYPVTAPLVRATFQPVVIAPPPPSVGYGFFLPPSPERPKWHSPRDSANVSGVTL